MKSALAWAARLTYLDAIRLSFLGVATSAATGLLAGLLHHLLP